MVRAEFFHTNRRLQKYRILARFQGSALKKRLVSIVYHTIVLGLVFASTYAFPVGASDLECFKRTEKYVKIAARIAAGTQTCTITTDRFYSLRRTGHSYRFMTGLLAIPAYYASFAELVDINPFVFSSGKLLRIAIAKWVGFECHMDKAGIKTLLTEVWVVITGDTEDMKEFQAECLDAQSAI